MAATSAVLSSGTTPATATSSAGTSQASRVSEVSIRSFLTASASPSAPAPATTGNAAASPKPASEDIPLSANPPARNVAHIERDAPLPSYAPSCLERLIDRICEYVKTRRLLLAAGVVGAGLAFGAVGVAIGVAVAAGVEITIKHRVRLFYKPEDLSAALNKGDVKTAMRLLLEFEVFGNCANREKFIRDAYQDAKTKRVYTTAPDCFALLLQETYKTYDGYTTLRLSVIEFRDWARGELTTALEEEDVDLAHILLRSPLVSLPNLLREVLQEILEMPNTVPSLEELIAACDQFENGILTDETRQALCRMSSTKVILSPHEEALAQRGEEMLPSKGAYTKTQALAEIARTSQR